MAFEEEQKEQKKSRKSMDFSNNKKIMNSASRLKAPTPNIDSDDGDGLFLNKSVEIKKRSRNKNSKFLNKNTSSKTINQKKSLLNLTRKDKDTTSGLNSAH